MDIVIHNGKINFSEMQKNHEKKNEIGLLKKDYNDFHKDIPGPYYDLRYSHLHVWRKAKLISNFHGVQDYRRIQFKASSFCENDTYCSICHCKVIYNSMRPIIATKIKTKPYTKPKNLINYDLKWKTFYTLLTYKPKLINKIKNKRIKIYTKYYQMVYKMLYKPIMYNITSNETKLIYPWELTYYQKFKMEFPNYKKNVIFLNIPKITENYVIIENKLQFL